jgi:hypothetical protein
MVTTAEYRGKTLYCHRREMPNGATFHFFNPDSSGAIDLPEGYRVGHNPRNGYPLATKTGQGGEY